MRAGTPFKAFHTLMALAGAMMAQQKMPLGMALGQLDPYEGRGKGKTARHNRGGTKANQRAALKRRNVLRNRKAQR